MVAATAVNLDGSAAGLNLNLDAPFQIDGLLGMIDGSESLGCLDISFADENQTDKNACLMLGSTGILSSNPEITKSIPIKMDLDDQTIDPGFENAHMLKEFSSDEEKSYNYELCFSFDAQKLADLLEGLALHQGIDGVLVLQYLTEKDGTSSENVEVSEKED